MSMEVSNKYNSYYTQVSNNSKSNVDKTIDSNKSTTNKSDKTISSAEYFENLCNKYPNANLNMSDSYINKDNEINFSISPRLINKATKDPKAAENLNRLMDQIPAFTQYVNTHRFNLCGSEVTSVSIVVDENGGCSCKCEYKKKNSVSENDKIYAEKLLESKIKKLQEKAKALKKAQEENIRQNDSKISKQQKAYYRNTAKNMDISFLDTNI